MTWARRLLGLATLALIAAAGAVELWPLHAQGVGGSAASPRYRDFGFVTYRSLPTNPTFADLRHAGIPVPRDTVEHRRDIARELTGGSLAAVVALGAAELTSRRRSAR